MIETTVNKEEKIQQLKKEIETLRGEVDYYNALQMSRKDAINGAYGAFANPHFCFFNNDLAATVTACGRNLIQWMDYKNESYWYDSWHTDTWLHNQLGIKGPVKPIDPSYLDSNGNLYIPIDRTGTEYASKKDWEKLWFMSLDKLERWAAKEVNPTLRNIYQEVVDMKHNRITRKVPVSIYVDTDSLFLSYHPAMLSCDWKGDCKEFIMQANKLRIAGYFTNVLNSYAKKYGVENIEDFEMERVDKNVVFLEKKCYVQNIVYEDGINYEEMSYLYYKGIEIIKSSTPKFARERVIEIIKYLFSHPDDYNIKDLLKLVKDLKREFVLADIEDICMQTSMNNYDAKVVNDKDKLEFVTGAHFSIKAAAFHNYLLNQNPNLSTKYEPIKSGNKVKYYYTKDSRHEIFAFSRGAYPVEFAPEIDMDIQFEKSVLNIVNRFVNVLGMPKINKRLGVVLPLFNFGS
jgi:DNA polymerase elongation subunit (family B)